MKTMINIGTSKGNITNVEFNKPFDDINFIDICEFINIHFDNPRPAPSIYGWAKANTLKFNNMESKFNVGDEIFFMKGNEPKKAKVKGIAFIKGEFQDLHFEKKGPLVIYSVGQWDTVNEDLAFGSKQELIQFLSDQIPEDSRVE